MSELVPQQVAGAVQQSATQQSSSSSSASYSFSSSSSSSSSSSTKVVKQSTTTVKSSSSSSSTVQSSSSTRSSSVSVKSSGLSYSDQMAGDLGIDVSKELDRLRLCMDSEMTNIHRDMFRLMPGSPTAPVQSITAGDSAVSTSTTTTSQQQVTGGDFGDFLVKMDPDAIRSCIDKAHDDRVKLNFDVQEFDSETINIKTVGNKIEVHATKKSKKGDEERSEEFTRVYELPTQNDVDPTKVTSSIYKDGVLTIELPVADALGDSKQ